MSLSFITHRRFNNVFSIFVAFVAIYILIAPFLGDIAYWWGKRTNKTGGYVYVSKDSPKKDLKNIPKENRIVIPSLLINQEIFEGSNALTLKKGLWHRPNTSTPNKGGNTVIAGHRFTYAEKPPFYLLDKLKENEKFSVYWQGKEYLYKVNKISTVSPYALEVESNTPEPMITLYTCTPLWTVRNRLVIQARLIEDTE